MTSDRSATTRELGRVRVDVTLPPALAAALRTYARTWQVSLSLVAELACVAYLQERASRADQSPVRLRIRKRPGPLAQVERRITGEARAALRSRGGRPSLP